MALELVLANAQPAHDVKEYKSVFYIKTQETSGLCPEKKADEKYLILFYETNGTSIDWTLLDYCWDDVSGPLR